MTSSYSMSGCKKMFLKIWLILAIVCLHQGLAFTTTPVEVEGTCPNDDWVHWGSHCYYFANSVIYNWRSALDSCISSASAEYSPSLVSIHSNTENEMIINQMNQRNIDKAWIGLYRNGTGQSGFYKYNSYSALYGILTPGSDYPWDADGVDTFYFGGGTEYDRYWCEYMCHMKVNCKAYTWYGYHYIYQWEYQCVGRSDRWDIMGYDSYAHAGDRRYVGDNGNVFRWSDNTEISYIYWANGEPDAQLSNSACAQITADIPSQNYRKWTDTDCNNSENYICKTPKLLISNDTDETQPQFKILLSGSFYSSTGEDFVQSCSLQYVASMNEKALLIGSLINSKLGEDLCQTMPNEDIKVVSSSSPMIFDGSQGETNPTFYLEIGPYLLISEVERCAEDIRDFIIPHSNWGEPLLPTIPGCPAVIFTSSYFSHVEDTWICLNAKTKRNETLTIDKNRDLRETTLNYGIGHIGQLRTGNGQDLDSECTNSYSTELYKSTSDMVQKINEMIRTGGLCVGSNAVNILAPSAFLSVNGNEGVSIQDYVLQPSQDMVFADVYPCADDVSNYLSSHDNWITPIIPQLPGCPAVIFEPAEFQEWFKEWICP